MVSAKPERIIVDYHSHILPGIDDGSRDVAMSLAMLQMMAQQGVTHCVATPHFYGYRRSVEQFLQDRAASYGSLQSRMSEDLPRILLGSETALYTDLPELPAEQLDALCVRGTRTLMLEMPFAQWRDFEVNALSRLCMERGYQVVLVHLERFLEFQYREDALRQILEMPLCAQINAEGLLDLRSRKRCLELFSQRKVHLLGSDCHDPRHRGPNLMQGRQILEKHLGTAALHRIDRYGEMLLGDELNREADN